MSVEDFDCTDDALLWQSAGINNAGLSYVDVDVAPTEIKVRQISTKTDSRAPDSDSENNSVSLIVDQAVQVGDFIWIGSTDDLPGTAAVPDSDILQVNSVKVTKDVKGRNARYRATCNRHSNTLPVS